MLKLAVILALALTFVVEGNKKVKKLTTKVNDLEDQFKKDRDELSKSISGLEAKLASDADTKYELIKELLEESKNVTADLQKEVEELRQEVASSASAWPEGQYCMLASGACPDGFTRHEGYLRAIKLYDETPTYIKPVEFGDSKMKHHFVGHKDADLYITACCKA